jgi:parallel beta-helix repeat protein
MNAVAIAVHRHASSRRRWAITTVLALVASFLVLGARPAGAVVTRVVDDDGLATQLSCDDPVPTLYSTVQSAVTDAIAGDTVIVCPGVYTEQVTIDKDLTVTGGGQTTTSIKAPGVMAASTCPGVASQKNIVDVCGAIAVEISDLTVTGPGPGSCNSINQGIYVVGGASLDFHDARVLDVADTPLSGCQNGGGIRAGSNALGQVGSANIHDATIAFSQKGNIVIDGPGSTGIVDGNTVTGVGATPAIAENGIQISRGAIGTVTDNIVSGHKCDNVNCVPTGSDEASGILLFAADPGTVVSGNTVTDNDIGVYVDSDATITENTITGNRGEGIVVGAPSFPSPGPGATPTIDRNRIVGNGTGLDNTGGAAVTAETNWWGCNAGPGDAACDSVTGTTDTDPRLVLTLSIADNTLTPGQTTTLTADLVHDSDGADTSGGGTVPPTPVAFSTTAGSVSPPSANTVNGAATSTLTAPITLTSETASATVDNQTVGAGFTVAHAPLTITPNSGPRGTSVHVTNGTYTPGKLLVAKYKTALAHPKGVVICIGTATAGGEIDCSGTIPNAPAAGADGVHNVIAKIKGDSHFATNEKQVTQFTLTP